jgi:hypothetical protein
MARKARKRKTRGATEDLSKEMWINPQFSMRGPDGDRGWTPQGNISPGSGARFLELADTALGITNSTKKKLPAANAHHVRKNVS